MASLALGVRFSPASSGTGDFVYSGTVTGYRSATVLTDTKIYRYRAESADLSQWEYGYGAWASGSNTLARTTVSFSSTGAKVSFSAAPQVSIIPFVEDILAFDDAMSLTSAQQLQAQKNLVVGSPIAGLARNLKITRGSATTLAIVADEIATETALGGQIYREASVSHTLTITNTGANGMDTGAAPASGYIAVYSITKGDGSTFAVLGVNVATNGAPTIYPGANMPSGYVASALIGIWPTNGSSQVVVGTQIDRHFYYQGTTMPSLTTNATAATLTSLSAAGGVPPNPTNSIILADIVIAQTIASQRGNPVVAGDSAGTGVQMFSFSTGAVPSNTTSGYLPIATAYSVGWFKDVPMLTSQTLYWADASGNGGNNVYVSGYTF